MLTTSTQHGTVPATVLLSEWKPIPEGSTQTALEELPEAATAFPPPPPFDAVVNAKRSDAWKVTGAE
jgi:hypothetical protein